MTPPKLYTVAEAAPLIRKSEGWVYRNIRKLPVTRIGHKPLFTEEQILQIIADAAEGPKRRKPAAQSQPPAKTTAKTKTAPPTNGRPIPQADYTVSRLYRDGAA